jgi:hypothetical protein
MLDIIYEFEADLRSPDRNRAQDEIQEFVEDAKKEQRLKVVMCPASANAVAPLRLWSDNRRTETQCRRSATQHPDVGAGPVQSRA